jgi:hypothetical protein
MPARGSMLAASMDGLRASAVMMPSAGRRMVQVRRGAVMLCPPKSCFIDMF